MPRGPARELHAEDALERQLLPFLDPLAPQLQIWVGGKALVGQHHHCREAHAAKRHVIISISFPEVRADSGIAEERVLDIGSDFLEKDNVGRLESLENVIEDEFAA